MDLHKHKIFHAQIDCLHSLLDWVRSSLVKVGGTETAIHQLELAVEETFVNIIHHAYRDCAGDVDLSIQVIGKKPILATIIFKDQGPAFNPLEQTFVPIDPSLPLEEIEEGGLGLFFIKQCVDEVTYRRQDPYNILTLIKKIDA